MDWLKEINTKFEIKYDSESSTEFELVLVLLSVLPCKMHDMDTVQLKKALFLYIEELFHFSTEIVYLNFSDIYPLPTQRWYYKSQRFCVWCLI